MCPSREFVSPEYDSNKLRPKIKSSETLDLNQLFRAVQHKHIDLSEAVEELKVHHLEMKETLFQNTSKAKK